MRSIRASLVIVVSAGAVSACGGTSFTGIDPASDSGATQDGATGDGSLADADTGAQADSGVALDAGGPVDSSTTKDSGVRPDASASCPDVTGRYEQLTAVGSGCGDLDVVAPQCIRATTTACVAHFVSTPAPGAVNGAANLQADGSFTGATLFLGTNKRTGCFGDWTAASSTMTVTCGGSSGSQSCVVSMIRAGACP